MIGARAGIFMLGLLLGCSGMLELDGKVFGEEPMDGGSDSDADSDTDSDTGTGDDPCEGITCDSPPPDECLDSSIVRDYLDAGYCEDGNCYYTFSDITCEDGCEYGACHACGNGVRQTGEECDDGNEQSGDGCSASCVLEYCGDEVVGSLAPVGDDFETGDTIGLEWQQGAPYGFAIDSSLASSGTYAIISTNAGVPDSVSWITLELHMSGQICFWYAGESESCCDAFQFTADSVMVFEQLGVHTGWTQYCHQVDAPGLHSFMWNYTKDGSENTGWDAYLIDDVVIIAEAYDEECDDGNTTDGDGCSADCQSE